jgi:hypothetical protein
MRHAEIAQLDDEVDVGRAHGREEGREARRSVGHDILMHVGDDAEADARAVGTRHAPGKGASQPEGGGAT